MKKKYVNNLPNGKEVIGTEVSVEDGKLVVEVEFEDEFDPNDGDFLVSKYGKVFIYSKKNPDNSFVYSAYCGVRRNDVISIDFSNMWTQRKGCRFATPEEKSAFLERLDKEFHKTWNAEKKCLEDVYVPKDGDFCVVNDCVFIYKKESRFTTLNGYYAGIDCDGDISINIYELAGCGRVTDKIRPATDEEKNHFLDRLKNELGKKWNQNTKKLEDIRWTPKKGDKYFFIDCFGIIQCTINLAAVDSFRIETNNCFKTEEAAQPYADKFKEILKNSKEE